MIVVSIIGIMASFASARFSLFQAKARQAEAKTNLTHLYSLQTTLHGETDRYYQVDPMGKIKNTTSATIATMTKPNDLGFALVGNPEKVRYQYYCMGSTSFGCVANSGRGIYNKVYPGCRTNDKWYINQTKELRLVGGDSNFGNVQGILNERGDLSTAMCH